MPDPTAQGTAGATELQIPVAAQHRLVGRWCRDVSVLAMFWNPSWLARPRPDALFSHSLYFADMKLNYAGVATQAGGFGVVGLAAKVLSVGDIVVTTEQAPDGTGEILNPTFSVLGLSWGKAFTDRVNFGATVNYVSEELANNVASGVAFDFGFSSRPDWHGFRLGMAMKHIGHGAGVQRTLIRDPVPVILRRIPSRNRGLSFSSASSRCRLLLAVVELRHSEVECFRLVALGRSRATTSPETTSRRARVAFKNGAALRGSYFGTFTGTIARRPARVVFVSIRGTISTREMRGRRRAQDSLWRRGNLGVDVAWRPVKNQFDDVVEVAAQDEFLTDADR